jgi:nitrogen-specific signal transduction histidine kinase/ActR/RegA family two-component response regulator
MQCAEEEKRKLEIQLQQAQKMEAIGTLAGGIAHDFNNILSVIMGNAELLMLSDISFSSCSELNQILNASQRAKQLVRQILAFSRQDEQQKLLIDLIPLVRETLDFLRASLPSTIELQHAVSQDAGAIQADPTQMQQVLINLSTNAAHAMEKNGGVLKIEFDSVTLTEEDVQIDPEAEPGAYVRLSVSDTGHGIDPGLLPRIFDPYFTTKGPDKGTGLGLAVVHGIVKSHGGLIKVYSEVGHGTVFHVFLPRADRAEKTEETPALQWARGAERVLLVDDEKPLVDMYQRMLGSLGYRVEGRTSPVEAVEAVRSNPKKYDLVITDMTMPQMTGYTLAKRLMQIHPGLPVILCSGFSDQVSEEKARAAGISAFLLKPVVLRDLASTLRAVLDHTSKQNTSHPL